MHTMLLSCRLDLLSMTDATVPHIRQRVNISQTAKGLHQVECTVEVVDEKDNATSTEQLTQLALNILQAEEKKLKDAGRKLAIDEVS